MRIRIGTFTLIYFALIASSSFAQATIGGIAIRFWDSKCNKGVAGVIVTGAGPQKIRKARSNAYGELVIENLIPGNYKLTARRYGFKRLIVPDIEIRARETLKDIFNLEYGFKSNDDTPFSPGFDPCKQIDKPIKKNPMHVG